MKKHLLHSFCIRFFTVGIIALLCSACGGSGGGGGETETAAAAPESTSQDLTAVRLSTNPPCSALAFNDGRGGNLWLHHSESNGLPVYLLSSQWQDETQIEAVRTDGTTETGNFTGFANPDGDGRLRAHYRFSRGCGSYTGRMIVSDQDKTCEIQLPASPCTRID